MASPLLERVRIQVEVLVPVLRAFRAELGRERADRIAVEALARVRRTLVQERHAGLTGTPRERWLSGVLASVLEVGDAVDVDMLRQDDVAIEFDVTGCRFAELFRELGEPELGAMLLCAMDQTAVDEIAPGEVTLDRATTLMQGGDRCRFRYRLTKPPG